MACSVNVEKDGKSVYNRIDNPNAPILSGVQLSDDAHLFFTSGIVPPNLDSVEAAKFANPYGDTYTQCVNALKRIEGILAAAGLSLRDVIYIRIYLVPDKTKDGQIDFAAWFQAYGEFFNNENNPTKAARTTLGIASLARPDLLVEIEAVAVYPEDLD